VIKFGQRLVDIFRALIKEMGIRINIDKKTKKYFLLAATAAVFLAVIAGCIFGARYWYKNKAKIQEQNFDGKVSSLQKQISTLQDKLVEVAKQNTPAALPAQEVVRREVIRQKSQDELLTAAVARVSPTVVSIVVSKDVPQLEVAYVNPFGDDPFFKDFGFQVPVYQQKGVARKQIGAGTGFLISADGYILTNKHVVSDVQADYTALLSDGQQKQAKVIYRSPDKDIAILKIDGNKYSFVLLGNSDNLKLGQTVVAIGNALGEYNNSVSVGIISGLNRNITASSGNVSEQLSGVIQTDAAINPGNSGGPLLDLSGNVMGINVATVQGSSNISFSIPINTVKEILKSVLGK
jgi:S1-C subfamily serine protease